MDGAKRDGYYRLLSRLNQVWWPFGQSRGIWNGRMAIEMCENRLALGGGVGKWQSASKRFEMQADQ